MNVKLAGQIEKLEDLRRIIAEPEPEIERMAILELDEHCRAFIARSSFVFLATANARGECDVSPKGDAPGFVHVLDDRTLVIPDRKGNRRADSLRNILENPHAGLLFVIPGVDWTLRVNGRARISDELSLRAPLAVRGKQPDLVIVVEIDEAFMHCPRCVLRAGLWDSDGWMPADEQPSFAAILRDHARVDAPVDAIADALEEYNRDLY